MELCFLFSVDSNLDELWTTFSLSHSTFVVPSIGTPNIRSLYLKPCTPSNNVLKAINSEEKVLDSTVFCLLLYHNIGALLINIIYPVCDHRVTLLAACEVSPYAVIVTARPRGCG